MWMPPSASVPPFSSARERRNHQLAGGREDDRRVELLRGVGRVHPARPAPRQPPVPLVAGHARRLPRPSAAPPGSPRARRRRNRRCPAACRAAIPDSRSDAEPDDARAQQRRRLQIREALRAARRRTLRRQRVLGVAAVHGPAGEVRRGRRDSRGPSGRYGQTPQVRCSQAMPTRSPGRKRAAPGPALSTTPTTWWPGNHGRLARREFALDHVQVRAADRAGPHPHQHFARRRAAAPAPPRTPADSARSDAERGACGFHGCRLSSSQRALPSTIIWLPG